MAVRREDPNHPEYEPSELAESVLGLLEEHDVDQKTCDAVVALVEAFEARKFALVPTGTEPLRMREPGPQSCVQDVRRDNGVALRTFLRTQHGVLQDALYALRWWGMPCHKKASALTKMPRTDIEAVLNMAVLDTAQLVSEIEGNPGKGTLHGR